MTRTNIALALILGSVLVMFASAILAWTATDPETLLFVDKERARLATILVVAPYPFMIAGMILLGSRR